jgi:hypothetical protein
MDKYPYDSYWLERNKIVLEQKAKAQLDADSKNAIIENSKKSWAEKNPIKFMLITALIASIFTKILDKLIP